MKEKASKIRKRIIDVMAKNGGHLASNLGVVELTVALHEVFNSPEDKLIFDTSHQTYAHKLLTGRSDRFDNIRKAGGLYGFAAPHESPHDHFYAGHGATSLSLALGCAKARDLTGGSEYIVPILGDAMLTCGLAYEALDNIPKNLKRFVIILNDNEMSIAKNVGAISEVLARLLNRPKSNKFYHEVANFLRKIPTFGDKLALKGKKLKESLKTLSGSDAPFFEHFNLAYVGPIDGHDIHEMIDVFKAVKDLDKPTIIHVRTIKGYGLDKAESAPIAYHGAQPFDPETGEFLPSKSQLTFPKVFGKYLLQMGERHKDVIAISPATPVGTAMVPFMEKFPDRSIDVGIAEGHSVTFAGACAYQNKLKPILSVYSTFLQRGFDNIFHDVCIQNLPVIFAIDRAGISSGDGITHHGIYDIAFLAAMPNMVICQPRSGHLLKELLESALSYQKPTAIRYPNLPTTDEEQQVGTRPLGQGEVLAQG
ncbi:MAG: 1-deoxy-D-xylulose-5-phosphate synthase, partial [Chlamydiia bacterium]|nr:1-deoxy-D-xylulose-5-phosphate synthase [Chlamydiia bacterium]